MSTTMPESHPVVEVSGTYVLKEGELFQSFEQVEERLRKHSEANFVNYWRRDTRTVKGALMKTTRPIAARLKYYSIRYACVHGGQKFSKRGQGQRSKQTMRTGCPSYIMFRADKYGQQLEVISVCNQHNHAISETDSQLLPRNRRLPPDVRRDVLQMLHHHIDRKKLIEYVRIKCGKHVTSKDLFNLRANVMKSNEEEFDRSSGQTRQELLNKIKLLLSESASTEPHVDHGVVSECVVDEIEQPPEVSSDLLKDMYYDMIEEDHILTDEFDAALTPQVDLESSMREDTTEIPSMDGYHEAEEVDADIACDDMKSETAFDDPMVIFENQCKEFEDSIIEDNSNMLDEEEDDEYVQNSDRWCQTPDEIEDTPEPESTLRLTTTVTRKSLSVDFTQRKTWKRDAAGRNGSAKNCKHCGLNAKLVRMQIAVLKAQKLKLDEETQILRLNKERLLAEVRRFNVRAIEE